MKLTTKIATVAAAAALLTGAALAPAQASTHTAHRTAAVAKAGDYSTWSNHFGCGGSGGATIDMQFLSIRSLTQVTFVRMVATSNKIVTDLDVYASGPGGGEWEYFTPGRSGVWYSPTTNYPITYLPTTFTFDVYWNGLGTSCSATYKVIG